MRTTITIDDDVLLVAKGLAVRDRRTVGEIISELARKGLVLPITSPRYRNGFPLMPVGAGEGLVTLVMVNRLREDAA